MKHIGILNTIDFRTVGIQMIHYESSNLAFVSFK